MHMKCRPGPQVGSDKMAYKALYTSFETTITDGLDKVEAPPDTGEVSGWAQYNA